jgi:ribosomal protein L19
LGSIPYFPFIKKNIKKKENKIMKYNVGDKVKIREDLVVGNMYGVNDFARKMAQYKGKTATITTTSEHNNMYHIDIDNECWYWTDEMFEEGHISKFNVGDKVRVRRDLEVGNKYNGLTLTSSMYACHSIMTIASTDDDNYTCEESGFFWGEDMLEKVEETEDNTKMTVEDLLNKTDVETGGLIIAISYSNAYFHTTIGHNKINRDSELYKRFIKAYGDMIVDEVSFDVVSENMVMMKIEVDYAD